MKCLGMFSFISEVSSSVGYPYQRTRYSMFPFSTIRPTILFMTYSCLPCSASLSSSSAIKVSSLATSILSLSWDSWRDVSHLSFSWAIDTLSILMVLGTPSFSTVTFFVYTMIFLYRPIYFALIFCDGLPVCLALIDELIYK